MSAAYDMIDRFLRNNLGSDDDYAEYSKALDSLCRAQPAQTEHDCYCGRTWKHTSYGWASTEPEHLWEPAQAGQVLTDDFIKAEALEAFDCYWDADDETLVNKYGHGVYLSRFIDFARAIEQAVLAKRVPQWIATSDQMPPVGVRVFWFDATSNMVGFDTYMGDGYSWASTHWMLLPPPPGIVGEKGGA